VDVASTGVATPFPSAADRTYQMLAMIRAISSQSATLAPTMNNSRALGDHRFADSSP
jgi:hypothetical protein